MGLDMYLRAKTTVREYKGATGACSGLFNRAPEDNGMVEIGYWRKAFDQRSLINHYCEPDDETNHKYISKENVEHILNEAKEILKTHKFDEDGYDITDEYDSGTFNSQSKWEDTIEFFEEAKRIYEEDPKASIYYLEWE